MKKLSLNLSGRMMLLNSIPSKGKLQVMVAARGLTEKLQLTSEEIDKFKIREEDVNGSPIIRWDAKIEKEHGPFEYEFNTESERQVLIDIMKNLDEAGNITPDLIDIAMEILSWDVVIPEESASEIPQ